MATNGIISIIKNGKVLYKIIAGCDGYDAKEGAKYLLINPPHSMKDAYLNSHMGCAACLIVQSEDGFYCEGEEIFEEPDGVDEQRYRLTFQNKYFNPRWWIGACYYTYVVDLDRNKMWKRTHTERPCYKCMDNFHKDCKIVKDY